MNADLGTVDSVQHTFLRLALGWLVALMAGLVPAAVGAQEAFDIFEYQVEGNESLPVDAIEKAVYPFLGEGRDVKDVEKARAALEQAYRDAGFLTVQVVVPEQEVKDKVVRLTVVGGKLSKLRVVGSRYYAQGRILERAPALKEGDTLYFPDVQKDVAGLNRTAALRVVPVLRPGPKFGTTEIDLNVTDQRPYGFNAALNNYYSPNTTELRLSVGARYDNLWQRGHAIAMTAQTSPQDTQEVKAFSASYAIPLDGNAGTLAAYVVASNSNVAVVGNQAVLGKGSIAGLRWNKPLPPVGGFNQSATVGADYKDFQQNIGQPGQPAIEQPIHYVPGVVSWNASRLGAKGLTGLSTGFTFGIRGLSDDEAVFANRRFNASGNFGVWRFEASRMQNLGSNLSAFVQIDGQKASGPLIVNEQFLGGGASQTSVRGYLEAEVAGDDGTHATVELRRNIPTKPISEALAELQVLAFSDGVYVVTQDPLPGQASYAWLSSAGLGLRARTTNGLRLRLDVGVPFKSTQYTEAGKPAAQFQVSYQY